MSPSKLHNQVQEWIFDEFNRRIDLAKKRWEEDHNFVLGWSYTFPRHSDLVIPEHVTFTGVSRENHNPDNKRRYDIKADIIILPDLVDRIKSCFQDMAPIDRRDDMLDVFNYEKAFNDPHTLEQFILWHMFDTHFRATEPFYEAQVSREEKLIGIGLPPDTDDLPTPNSQFGIIENLTGAVVDRLVKESRKNPISKSCLDRMPEPKNTDHFVIEVNSTNRKKRDFIDEVGHEKRWVFEVDAEHFWNGDHTVDRLFQCGQWLWPDPTLNLTEGDLA